MTTREYFQAVLDAHISAEMDEASRILIGKLDKKNLQRKSTLTKDQKEAAARKDAVLNFFYSNQEHPMTRDEIATALGMSPAQVTAACKPFVAEGAIVKAEAKIGKSRRIVYTMPREE